MDIAPIIFDNIPVEEKKKRIRVLVKENVENFNEIKITNSLMKETGIDNETAREIVSSVVERIFASKTALVTSRMIREMVLSVLVEAGMIDAYKKYSTVGMPTADVEKLLMFGDHENANVSFNPQSVLGKISDDIMKKYTLTRTLPKHLSRSHVECEIHVHDLQFFELGMFCQAWDTRMILRFGLPPTRTLKSYKYSKPTSDMRVACLHLANWFSYAQSVFSGGQGYMAFNTVLAPYARGLTDSQLKKALMAFVFQVNQQRDSRGHQLPFTSIDLNLGVDSNFKNCHAIFDGEILEKTYEDYEEESARIVEILSRIYKSGDANGTPFSFSKFELKASIASIEKHPHVWNSVADLIAYNGAPYILNGEKVPETAHSQCCRIIFNPDGSISKFCVDPEKFKPTDDHFPNFGSMQSVSINLPRVALDARKDEMKVISFLDDRLEKALEVLKIKRSLTYKNIDKGFPALYCIDVGKEKLIDMDLEAVNIGIVGLNEMIENIYKTDLSTSEGHAFGKFYLNHIAKWCHEKSIENKMMINLWEQPAESTANRFASYDVKKFGENASVRGPRGDTSRVYYTNSCHIPYDARIDLPRRLKMQGDYHPIIKGGVISHVFLGEHRPDPGALTSFIKKLMVETDTYYTAFTPDFTICGNCGKNTRGIKKICGYCFSENVDYLSRVTGYYALVSLYNGGKLQEFDDRVRYDI